MQWTGIGSGLGGGEHARDRGRYGSGEHGHGRRVLPPGAVSEPVKEVATLFNTALPEKGAGLSSPVSGAIVRWRLVGAKGGPFRLRVLRPNGQGAYTAVGTGDPMTPLGPGLETFSANLPVKAGDLLAVDPTNPTDELGFVTAAGAAYGTIFPTPFEGATVPGRDPVTGKEIELSAEVQPTPTVESISVGFGPVAGGTAVKIVGKDLTGTSAVKFGTEPAASFKVESDTEILATAPRSKRVARVDITVTTLAGTSASTSRDRFGYLGCQVPKLRGLRVAAAKHAVRISGCRLGEVKVRKGTGKGDRKVKSQSLQAGSVLKSGTKVNFTLG
jgi:PASTA domain/IPT/TIG domain